MAQSIIPNPANETQPTEPTSTSRPRTATSHPTHSPADSEPINAWGPASRGLPNDAAGGCSVESMVHPGSTRWSIGIPPRTAADTVQKSGKIAIQCSKRLRSPSSTGWVKISTSSLRTRRCPLSFGATVARTVVRMGVTRTCARSRVLTRVELMQCPTAMASDCTGLGPRSCPTGGGSSVVMAGNGASAKSTLNWYFSTWVRSVRASGEDMHLGVPSRYLNQPSGGRHFVEGVWHEIA